MKIEVLNDEVNDGASAATGTTIPIAIGMIVAMVLSK